MHAETKDAVEERTRHWLEANYLSAIANLHDPAHGVYDAGGQPQRLTAYHFQEVQRKLKIFRWLDRLRFSSFIDIGSGFDQYPNLVRERYGVPSYYSDFAHSMNLPYGGAEYGKLDNAITLNIVRLPFADDAFDVVLSSEVLEHLVRPVDAIAELLRITRTCLIMTSLEALSVNRWQRFLSHARVDISQPHVERNFFLLDELDAIFGPEWHHENLFYDETLPTTSSAPLERQDQAYAKIRDAEELAAALSKAVSVNDHRHGSMGILIVKPKPGTTMGAAADAHALARWLIERTAAGQRAGFRLVDQIRKGTAAFTTPERPLAPQLLALLRCPDCRAQLAPMGPGARCQGCGTSFPGEYGVPVMYPQHVEASHDGEEDVLRRLCGTDTRRQAVVRRIRDRLRRNEEPPGALRRLFWRVDQLLR
jgi:SAM-dependent methyltransferase